MVVDDVEYYLDSRRVQLTDGDAHLIEPAGIKDALVRQAAGAVRWVECVQSIGKHGVTHVIECGPGKVLAGLTKRIDGNLVGASIVDPASLDEVLKVVAA